MTVSHATARLRRLLLVAIALTPPITLAQSSASQPATAPTSAAVAGRTAADLGVDDISDLLEPIREEYDLPALAAAVVHTDGLAAIGAVGVRKFGDIHRVTIEDQFHLGSCTKSMAATVAAILVERGQVRWDTTVAQAFPDLADDVRPEYRNVTLEQLLCHRSGLPEDRTPGPAFFKVRMLTGTPREQRHEMVRIAMNQEPASEPGSKFQYSNFGVSIAGAMCEAAADEAWEDLAADLLFKSLGMTSAGFGAPGDADKIDEPWGHLRNGDTLTPIPPGPLADNPVGISPAGLAHCSLIDWARYAQLHLAAARGEPKLLKAETFDVLHTDKFHQQYAFGWGILEGTWANGVLLQHAGSNGMWFAIIAIAPERDIAILAATNCGDQESITALNAAAKRLVGKYAE